MIPAKLLLTPLVPLLVASPEPPEEATWPWWRGPNRDGISAEGGWSPTGRDQALWTRDVGLGYSAVAIADGRLFTAGYDEEAKLDQIWCLDPGSGEVVWKHTYASEIWNKLHGGGTLTTPSVDKGAVYTLNREGNVHRFDAADGKVRWSKNLHEELEIEEYPTWGYSASPFVRADTVLLHLGQVVALDKASGEVRWRSKGYGHAYSTPTEFEVDGKPRLAVFASEGLAVLDLSPGAEGRELGFHPWKTQYDINAATPVVDGRRVFFSSGLGRGCGLVELGDEGLEVIWESKVMRNKMSGCVLWEGHLYGYDETAFKCIDLEGEERWRERTLNDGAFMIADGKLILTSKGGELVVAEASPEGYRELSRTTVLEEGVFWTSPVLADGRIYVRSSAGQLTCRDHRPGAEER